MNYTSFLFRGGGFSTAKCIPDWGCAIAQRMFALVIVPCSQMSAQRCLFCWLKLWLSWGPCWALLGKLVFPQGVPNPNLLQQGFAFVFCLAFVPRALPAVALPSSLTWLNLSEIPGFLLENINVILLKLPLPYVSSPSRSLIRHSSARMC